MKVKKNNLLLYSTFLGIVLASISGCQNNSNVSVSQAESENTVSISENSSERQISKDSAVDISQTSEISESSADEEKQRQQKIKNDASILLEYKKKLEAEPVKDIRWETELLDGGNEGHNYGKLYYYDSVLRDINNDGKIELIVKYDLRQIVFPQTQQYTPSATFTYDIVSVVDGKAVATEHYMNEEGLYYSGAQR